MLKLIDVQSRFKIIFVAGILLVGLIFVILVVSLTNRQEPSLKEKGQTQASPLINPQVVIPPKTEREKLPKDVQQIREKIIAAQIVNEKGDIVLYTSSSYRIIYVPTPDIFFVMISKEPVQNFQQEAQKWFLNFGLEQSDLCDLPVRFVLTERQLKQANPNFNILPDGCG